MMQIIMSSHVLAKLALIRSMVSLLAIQDFKLATILRITMRLSLACLSLLSKRSIMDKDNRNGLSIVLVCSIAATIYLNCFRLGPFSRSVYLEKATNWHSLQV